MPVSMRKTPATESAGVMRGRMGSASLFSSAGAVLLFATPDESEGEMAVAMTSGTVGVGFSESLVDEEVCSSPPEALAPVETLGSALELRLVLSDDCSDCEMAVVEV